MHQRDRMWTPLQVKRLAVRARNALDGLVPEYRSGFTYVHGRRDNHHPTEEEREQQAQIKQVRRISDPTGDIVAEQEENRRRLARAAANLEHATKELETALDLVKRVFDRPDDYFRPLESYRSS